MSNLPVDIASTMQSASIKRDPSPHHDINPSTAASTKRPVSPTLSITSSQNSIPYSALQPSPRRANLPPLPDLRFEQSYLASLNGVESWWGIAYVTGRDQVVLPLAQGLVWTLVLSGWRFWNRGAQFKGAGLGSRVRRWWWGVNGWDMPKGGQAKRGEQNMAEHVGDYYTMQVGAGCGD